MKWCDEQVQIISPVSYILIITVSWLSLYTYSNVSGNLEKEREKVKFSKSPRVVSHQSNNNKSSFLEVWGHWST